jgi:hypothetical protein
MGLLFTIAADPRQRSHSQVRVPRNSWPHFTVSDSRLPQPGGPGPRTYISQEQGDPVIPPGTGFLQYGDFGSHINNFLTMTKAQRYFTQTYTYIRRSIYWSVGEVTGNETASCRKICITSSERKTTCQNLLVQCFWTPSVDEPCVSLHIQFGLTIKLYVPPWSQTEPSRVPWSQSEFIYSLV